MKLLYNYVIVPSGGPAAANVEELGGAERISCTQSLALVHSVYNVGDVPDEDMSVY